MRRIGVATFARSEYSTCLPLLRAIQADAEFELHLLVSGAHLSPEFGNTVKDIEADGFAIADRIEMRVSSDDTPEGVVESNGWGTIGFAHSFARSRPDILLLVGDRLELLAAASAALPFRIPVAHVSGGDVTEGALDNQVRHAMSKLSHLHFVAMEEHAQRLLQMGEEGWRVFVTGDPALDLVHQVRLLSRRELSQTLGRELTSPVVIVTFHPTTLGSISVHDELDSLLAALTRLSGTLILTSPNADAGNRTILNRLQEFTGTRPHTALFFNLGQLTYYSLMAQADLMLGNSSSGIWEAPTFRLPVVNVGDRQRGRIRAGNVIDAPPDADAIEQAIHRGLQPAFRASLRDLQNPYGDGRTSPRIVSTLKRVALDTRLLQKRFVDRPVPHEHS
jgi:UDP-hydrolysing UDP-N-acetyl-D-glucosamine 2-epimerase